MAKPITAFAPRRAKALILTLIATLLLWAFMLVGEIARIPTALFSGIFLYALMLLLTAFNARKKIPFIPLFSASAWLQFHIYTGLFSLIVFAFHTQLAWPRGTIEIALAAIFLIVCLSGFIGLFISRWLPKRMQTTGPAITYEKIPQLKRALIQEIESDIAEAERETKSSTLSDFYLKKLRPFFDSAPGLLYPFASHSKFRSLQNETENLTRYLDDTERAYHKNILSSLEQKHRLDYMQSANRLLRVWLFIHIPFTFSLLIVGLIHGIIALMYGGAR
ncbi:MAG: hypothetical protein ACSHX8_13780 [Opitutaceae bacterium]